MNQYETTWLRRGSMLRMLLGQEIIPGHEFQYMQIVYALVMLIPLLHIIAVVATFRSIHVWRRMFSQQWSAQPKHSLFPRTNP